jgi:hypothetical protein
MVVAVIINMMPHEQHEAINVIDSIFYIVSISKDTLREDEAKLAAELRRMWRQEYTDALKKIFETVPDEFTEDALKFLEEELLTALGPSFGTSKAARELLRKYISESYIGGKKEFVVKPSTSLPDSRAIESLTKHNCFWLGQHYGEHIGPKISELTQRALDTGIGRKALAEDLKKELGGVAPEDYRYWDVVSSAALVRSRSFGAISGMEEAGFTEYEILAMMDERTCAICGEMNGRVFSVSAAKTKMNEILEIKDPNEFKSALPWQNKPPVGVKSKTLMSEGKAIPPFHGLCRCTLIAAVALEPVTKESFPRVSSENVQNFDTDTRIATITSMHGRTPAVGLPHWKYDILSSDGTIATRRFFGGDGKTFLDVDFTDHGDAKKHPYAPHSHDWVDGIRGKTPRKPKKWEKEMVEELKGLTKIMKSKTKEGFYQSVHFATVEAFMHDIEHGGETQVKYDGHDYFITGLYSAWEMLNSPDQNSGEYQSVDEMLDDFKVHTGETLREIATKVDVICCHSDAKLVNEDGTEVPW